MLLQWVVWLGFKVLFGLATLLYCRRSFEVVGDVSTIASIFTGLSVGTPEESGQKSAVYQGKYSFHWVLGGKNWKLA